MGDGAVISCCLQSNDGWILHGKCQQPRKSALRACSTIIALFKRLRSIIDGCSDIGIASKICSASFAFKEFRMIPRAKGMFFSKFFRMGHRTNELQSYFPPVFEFAPVKHIKSGCQKIDARRSFVKNSPHPLIKRGK